MKPLDIDKRYLRWYTQGAVSLRVLELFSSRLTRHEPRITQEFRTSVLRVRREGSEWHETISSRFKDVWLKRSREDTSVCRETRATRFSPASADGSDGSTSKWSRAIASP